MGEATQTRLDEVSTAARAAAIESEGVGAKGGTSTKESNFSGGTEDCLVAERVFGGMGTLEHN